MSSPQPGAPPIWRLVIYALIAMAIPAYFFYPHLHDSRFSGVRYFIALLIPVGLVAYFAFVRQSSMSDGINQTPEGHVTNRLPRTIGTILFVIGAALAKWQIYDPLHAAEEKKQAVWVSSKLVGLAILFSIYGLALILFGNKTNKWLKIDPKNMGWRNAVFLIAIASICFATYLWVERALAQQGYQ